MLAILERIAGKKKQVEAHRHSAYLAIVDDIAAGNDVDDDQTERVLAESGKSPKDLERDVKTQTERIRIRAELARLPELKKQRDALQTTIDAAYAALEVARAEYDRATRPAADQICAIDAALREESKLRQKLLATCLDGEARQEWEAAKAALGKRTQERDRLRPALRDMREKALVSAGLARDAAHAESAEQHRAAAERQNRLADEYEGRLAELDAEIVELEKVERNARETAELA